MKKTILIIFLLIATLGFSQNYNGNYVDNKNGLVLKISNYNKNNGSLTFEIIADDYPCNGSRKEVAFCCEYDESSPNEFVFQTGQDDGAEFLYLTFKTNGSVTLSSAENESFNIVGMCSIFEPTIFNKVIPKKKDDKKAPAKKVLPKKSPAKK